MCSLKTVLAWAVSIMAKILAGKNGVSLPLDMQVDPAKDEQSILSLAQNGLAMFSDTEMLDVDRTHFKCCATAQQA